MGKRVFLPVALEEYHFLALSSFQKPQQSLACGPFFHLKSQARHHSDLCIHHYISFSDTFTFKDLCVNFEPTQMILGHVPSFMILNLITYKVTYSQVLGIMMGASLGGHYSTYLSYTRAQSQEGGCQRNKASHNWPRLSAEAFWNP